MDKVTRTRVIERAGNVCEYCHLPQFAQPFVTFHIDHVVPSQHRRDDSLDNLCLSCQSCNLHKGTNLSTVDPNSDAVIPVFNPRIDRWTDHFKFVDSVVVGVTTVGQGTIKLLAMNTPQRVELRKLRGVGCES